uniref:Uncharacterized protein n=1 Tax=Oryza meridionalis TaxID=40149 RepID=A0A0E0DY16_9ORYZ
MVNPGHKQLEDFSNPLALKQPCPHLLVQIGVNQLIPEKQIAPLHQFILNLQAEVEEEGVRDHAGGLHLAGEGPDGVEVDNGRRRAADAAHDGGEEERVGEREEAAAGAAEAEAGVEQLEIGAARPGEDVVDEVLCGGGAAAGGGRGQRREVGRGRVAEPRAERRPPEEREREVRVALGGDRLGKVPRREARPEPRDPRSELLVRRRADGGLGLHHARGHSSCFFSSRSGIGAEAAEAAREAAGGGGGGDEECHGGRPRLLRPRQRLWIWS